MNLMSQAQYTDFSSCYRSDCTRRRNDVFERFLKVLKESFSP